MLEMSYHNGKTKYYTGITSRDIGKRFGDHLFGRGRSFVFHQVASKKPVYIEYFFGYQNQAMKREKTIKRLKQSKKRDLILSGKNMLRGYKPLKHIILRKNGSEEELVFHIK